MKNEVIRLRSQGMTYKEITKSLGISKSTISFHLGNTDLKGRLDKIDTKITKNLVEKLKEYYKNHTIEECVVRFGISRSSVIKYTERKSVVFSDIEKSEKNYQRVKNYRQKMKLRLVEYKGGKCSLCGYNKCVKALEFHHIDPHKKDFQISRYSNLKWETVVREVDKCILVCSNCHREIHDGLRNVSPLPDKE